MTNAEGVDSRHLAAVSEEGERVFIRHIYRQTNDESFSGGIVDLVKFTHLQISFEIESVGLLNDESKVVDLKAWMASILERFVDLYRLVTQEGDIVRFRLQEIPIVDIWISDNYVFTANMIDAKQIWHGRWWDWSDLHYKLLQEASVAEFSHTDRPFISEGNPSSSVRTVTA